MIEPKTLAENILRVLQAEPRNYKKFGIFWYLIKALLKKFYTKDDLYLLGDYVDKTVTDRIPNGMSIDVALIEALQEYQQNSAFGLGSNPVDRDGEEFVLMDQDAGL